MHASLGDSIAAGRPSNWEDTRRPSFAGLYLNFCQIVFVLFIGFERLLAPLLLLCKFRCVAFSLLLLYET